MEKRNTERIEDLPTVETPEDVAVLYTWANLHGAKYRDFSASRREYRAQLRHRAAEQAREQELRAQANAETAATFAEKAAHQAEEVAMANQTRETEHAHQQALYQAEEAARVAMAERMEAARRAEAAAIAEATARREEREIADANASARRQAAQYAESESRRRHHAEHREIAADLTPELPGEISDPYTPQSLAQPRPLPSQQPDPRPLPSQQPGSQSPSGQQTPATHAVLNPMTSPYRSDPPPTPAEPMYTAPPQPSPAIEYTPTPQPPPATSQQAAPLSRRPQGYRPDDASGVRQIYRGPEFETSRESRRSSSARQAVPAQEPAHISAQAPARASRPAEETSLLRADDHAARNQRSWAPLQAPSRPVTPAADRASAWSDGLAPSPRPDSSAARQTTAGAAVPALPPIYTSPRPPVDAQSTRSRSVSPFSQHDPQENLADPTPRRRRQDAPGYKEEHPSDSGANRRDDGFRGQQQRIPSATARVPVEEPAHQVAAMSEPSGPAWLYATTPQQTPSTPQSSVADTLQHSRERVASRWYALKGVFEQPGQEQAEPAPVRQKEIRTPILAVFSMAGGVGKTSLVATLGRSLSSLGEKVLLTDTTSQGLLPFYFGASELRQGTVRTFSPPSGSTDAPIYLVSYDVDGKAGDEAAQETLVDEITESSRGTHRVLLDLTVNSGWVLRRMARLSPTILVPVAADMNSVISLQSVEKYFDGVVDSEGRPLKIFYLLNQFDASLPLHLDIREVLRRQLGDRLLPFVIRRAPAVGEALAEGMTIVDYSPEAPVAEDYLNAATWLRTVAAPATAGFRNVRWSER